MTTIFSGVTVQAAQESVTTVEDTQTTTSGEMFKIQYFGTWYEETGYSDLFSNGDDHWLCSRKVIIWQFRQTEN